MNRFVPRLDILPHNQRALYQELRIVRDMGFVLYGGTAIALRLGHRRSVDFDFFSSRPFDEEILRTTFPFLENATSIQTEAQTLSVVFPESSPFSGVKLSFFGSIALGRLGEPERTEDGCVTVASPRDLLALKIAVVRQRIEQKDYIDIAALLESGLDLAQGLADAATIYGATFSVQESLRTLVYFGDGDFSLLSEDRRKILYDAVSAVSSLGKLPAASLQSRDISEGVSDRR